MASAILLPQDPLESGRRSAAIRSLHVHPQRIGLGIGRQLWGCIESFLLDHRCARAGIDSIAANARARRFFEAAGCRLVRIAPRGVEGVPIAMYEFDVEATYSAGRHPRAAG